MWELLSIRNCANVLLSAENKLKEGMKDIQRRTRTEGVSECG